MENDRHEVIFRISGEVKSFKCPFEAYDEWKKTKKDADLVQHGRSVAQRHLGRKTIVGAMVRSAEPVNEIDNEGCLYTIKDSNESIFVLLHTSLGYIALNILTGDSWGGLKRTQEETLEGLRPIGYKIDFDESLPADRIDNEE